MRFCSESVGNGGIVWSVGWMFEGVVGWRRDRVWF